MAQAQAVYYLPWGLTLDKFINTLTEREEAYSSSVNAGARTSLTQVTVNENTRSLEYVISRMKPNGVLVLWEIEQVRCPWEKFITIIEKARFKAIFLKIINPFLEIDPNTYTGYQMLVALSRVENRYKSRHKRKLEEHGYGKAGFTEAQLEEIKKRRREGATLKEIAALYTTSVKVIWEICDGIPYIKKRRERGVFHEKEGFSFEYKEISKLDLDSELKTLINYFLKSLRSQTTKKNYFSDIKRFFLWAKNAKTLKDINKIDLSQSYFEYLSEGKKVKKGNKYVYGHSKTTVKKYYIVVRTFLEFCRSQGYVDINSWSMQRLPRTETNHVKAKPLRVNELSALIERAKKSYINERDFSRRMKRHRNYIVILLLATTGARPGSIVRLKKSDVETVNEGGELVTAIHLYSKGYEYKAVLNKNVAGKLHEYLEEYYKNDLEGNCYIYFANDPFRYEKMSVSALNKMLSLHGRMLGFEEGITGHRFRVSVAVNEYRSGKTLKEIQRKLYHQTEKQTEKYITPFMNEPEGWLDKII